MRHSAAGIVLVCMTAATVLLVAGDLVTMEARAAGWRTGTVDVGGQTWVTWISVAVNGVGDPRIAYSDGIKFRYAEWAGGDWDIVDVDGAGCTFPSLALDATGSPRIAYVSGGSLKLARWTGTAWTNTTLEAAGTNAAFPSIALDAGGRAHLSYYDAGMGRLRYASWTGVGWRTETVDNATKVGMSTSIALDSSGYPHIGYWDDTNRTVRYASWTGSAWRIQTVGWSNITGVHIFTAGFISLALDPAGTPHLAYPDFNRSAVNYASLTGTTWDIVAVESTSGYAAPSLAFDASGRPHLVYGERGLRHAWWTGTAWSFETVDPDPYAGVLSSLAVDADSYLHVGYWNRLTGGIEYATNAPPNSPPGTPSTPTGGASGQAGTPGNFSTSTTDPDGDAVRYTFDWGDGTQTQTGYLASGATANASHAWGSPGTYSVRAMATDVHGATSAWSGSSIVTITAGGSPPANPTETLADPWMWSTLVLVGAVLAAAILTLVRRRKQPGKV